MNRNKSELSELREKRGGGGNGSMMVSRGIGRYDRGIRSLCVSYMCM